MGNNCNKPPPSPTNQCNVEIGQDYTLANFCTLEGVGGNSYRETWCEKLGSPGEWGVGNSNAGSCAYNDCQPYIDVGAGCCRGCCGIAGAKVGCQRKAYNGNPVQCCLNDYTCNSDNNALCF